MGAGRMAAVKRRPPVILGYHGIDVVDPRDDPVRLFVSPADFRRQIGSMLRRGYEFVSMTELGRRIDGVNPPDQSIAAITFDDGTVDQATIVPALLGELGVPATIYVCPDLLGTEYPWADSQGGRTFMTREQLELIASNPLIEIGAHTNRHTTLESADFEMAEREMRECKGTIEAMLGVEVTSFCYPRCWYTPACLEAAKASGYTTAVTCGARGSWNRFELPRPVIHTPDGRLTFALKSRHLYHALREYPPVRLLRTLTRGYRHRAERQR